MPPPTSLDAGYSLVIRWFYAVPDLFECLIFTIMQIFLSKNVSSLTGSLNKNYGYAVQKRNGAFYGVRKTKGVVPPDGHWRFLCACAKIAKSKIHATAISVHWSELYDALFEAHHVVAADIVGRNGREAVKLDYSADDIINLKITFSL